MFSVFFERDSIFCIDPAMKTIRELYRQLGWDAARAQRHKRLIELGILPANCQLSPRDRRVPAWADAPHKDWEAERMAAFAAQVDSLDQSVGRLLGALRQTGADRTRCCSSSRITARPTRR